MNSYDSYQNPLAQRYSSKKMLQLFSERKRYEIWRSIWTELARASSDLGLNISKEQVDALEEKIKMTEKDFQIAKAREKEVRHDVMSHVYSFGKAAPKAAGIIHLGATSCDITDNADLIIYREALIYIWGQLRQTIKQLSDFSRDYAALPTLGYTHYQPAQITTVGKRASLWMQDFVSDFEEIKKLIETLPFRGIRGATGTQASFLELFQGNHKKVIQLEQKLAEAFDFNQVTSVCGQTYSRKIDTKIVEALAGIANSAAKFANDLRILCHEREIEEPFEKNQIGSSAMPFKRNPMRSERINSLSRSLAALVPNTYQTTQTQWLERTLDDSANRRLTLSEAFLLADSILILMNNISNGLVVNETIITSNLKKELPFLASEPILMAAVSAGGNRQELHEILRQYTHAAITEVKKGNKNNLVENLIKDPIFGALPLDNLLDPKNPIHIGRAEQQTLSYLEEKIEPLLEKYKEVQFTSDLVQV